MGLAQPLAVWAQQARDRWPHGTEWTAEAQRRTAIRATRSPPRLLSRKMTCCEEVRGVESS